MKTDINNCIIGMIPINEPKAFTQLLPDNFLGHEESTILIGAMAEGFAAGVIWAEMREEGCEIMQLAVHPEFRRRGIGSKLIESFLSVVCQMDRMVSVYGFFVGDENSKTLRSVKHKSPVSLLYGNHFVTIIGIQGTKIKYLDSGSMRKDGVRFGDLKDMCGSGLGQKMQLVWFEQLDEGGKNVVQNVTERTDAVYDGDKLRIEKNKLEGDDRYIDKGMERCYNKKAVAFNDKKSRMEKQRALMNMNSKYRAGNKVLNRNDNYIINDKIYIPRRIKQN